MLGEARHMLPTVLQMHRGRCTWAPHTSIFEQRLIIAAEIGVIGENEMKMALRLQPILAKALSVQESNF
jgi:hypothetical protein